MSSPFPGTTLPQPDVPWHRTITGDQWRVLVATKFGWMLAAMDFMLLFMLAAATIVPIYGQMARNPLILLLVGPLVGYFGSGHLVLPFLITARHRGRRGARPARRDDREY